MQCTEAKTPYNMASRIIKKIQNMGMMIAALSICAVTMFLSLNQTDYANGWDGYYYIIQVKSWLTEGAMHSPDVSPVYWLMIAVSYITEDYVLAYKISAVLIKMIFAVSVYYFTVNGINNTIKETQGKCEISAVAFFVCSLVIMSPSGVFFASQFPKNFLGFAFFLFLIPSVHSMYTYAISNFSGLKDLFWKGSRFIVLFALTFITHRFAGALALVLALSVVLLVIIKKKIYSMLIVFTVFVGILLVLSVFFPGTLHVSDLARLKGMFNLCFGWTPYTFMALLGRHKFSLIWIIEMAFLYGLSFICICFVAKWLVKKEYIKLNAFGYYAPVLAIALGGMVPFLHIDLMGVSYRIFLGFLLFSPLLAAPFITHIHKNVTIALTVLCLACSWFTMKSYNPDYFDPPYALYSRIGTKALNCIYDKDYDLIVAHKALAEIITYTTGKDALPWKPDPFYDRKKVWRIAAGIEFDRFKGYLDKNKIKTRIFILPEDYILVREDIWDGFVGSTADPVVKEAVRSWRNPHEVRPFFILKGRT